MEIRERIELAGITLCYAVTEYAHRYIDEDIMNCYRDTYADEILNLPVSDKGNCGWCNAAGYDYHDRGCQHCDGTGKRSSKTLKHLIEEAQND